MNLESRGGQGAQGQSLGKLVRMSLWDAVTLGRWHMFALGQAAP